MNEIQSHRSIVSNACQIPIPPSEDIAKLLSAIDIFPMKRETIENFCSEGSNQRLQAKMILLNDGDFRALNAATLEGYPCGFDPNTELFPTEFEQINCDSPAENNVINYSYLHPCGKAAFDFQKVLENTPSLKESVLHFSRTLNDKAQSFASISDTRYISSTWFKDIWHAPWMSSAHFVEQLSQGIPDAYAVPQTEKSTMNLNAIRAAYARIFIGKETEDDKKLIMNARNVAARATRAPVWVCPEEIMRPTFIDAANRVILESCASSLHAHQAFEMIENKATSSQSWSMDYYLSQVN
eukprot:GDKK01002951.1.p1 GENE.GDKK01002951.1~~GDKK01002951.1.p1  ORF type:complete len:317 (-),score=51.99 GDKK01002951.1:96-986(-)